MKKLADTESFIEALKTNPQLVMYDVPTV